MTNQIMVKMALDAWHARVKEASELFDNLTDEQLNKEVSLDRNRGIYLLGHLIAVHDRMLPLLNFEEQLYPQLTEPYLHSPDKSGAQTATIDDLRQKWKNINSKLTEHFNNLAIDEWFQKHNSVSSEDFIKEPHRNKLNVLISRTNHLSYHLGQLVFLKN